jgi:hypothetical protein
MLSTHEKVEHRVQERIQFQKSYDQAVNLVYELGHIYIPSSGLSDSFLCKYRRVLSKARERVLRREKKLQFQRSDCSNAGELAQSSPSSVALQGAATITIGSRVKAILRTVLKRHSPEVTKLLIG